MNFPSKRTESKTEVKVAATAAKLQTWYPELGQQTLDKLRVYQEELVKFNKAINLISGATLPRIEAVHFADSLLASKLIYPALIPKKDVYDYGSGNGFPGLVMSILFSDFNFILVDRDSRKAEFLKHMASRLELKNVKVLVQALEDIPDGQVFNAVARGFAALHKTMLLSRKSMAKGGKFFHLKGDGFASELASVPSQLFSHWEASLIGNYTLPDTNSVGTVVLTTKTTD